MRNNSKKVKKILIVEDDFISAEVYKDTLLSLGCGTVNVVHDSKEAVKKALALKPHYIFLDIGMEYKTAGIDVCNKIKKQLPRTKVYFLTAYDLESFEDELINVDFDGYIDKLNFVDDVLKIIGCSDKRKGSP